MRQKIISNSLEYHLENYYPFPIVVSTNGSLDGIILSSKRSVFLGYTIEDLWDDDKLSISYKNKLFEKAQLALELAFDKLSDEDYKEEMVVNCQHVIELSLKALLSRYANGFSQSHDLIGLYNKCVQTKKIGDILNESELELLELTSSSYFERYGIKQLNIRDFKQAVLSFCNRNMLQVQQTANDVISTLMRKNIIVEAPDHYYAINNVLSIYSSFTGILDNLQLDFLEDTKYQHLNDVKKREFIRLITELIYSCLNFQVSEKLLDNKIMAYHLAEKIFLTVGEIINKPTRELNTVVNKRKALILIGIIHKLKNFLVRMDDFNNRLKNEELQIKILEKFELALRDLFSDINILKNELGLSIINEKQLFKIYYCLFNISYSRLCTNQANKEDETADLNDVLEFFKNYDTNRLSLSGFIAQLEKHSLIK